MSTAAIEVLSSLSETFQSAQAVIKLHDYGYKDFFPRLLSTLTQTIITLLPFSNSTNPRIDRMVNMKISLSHVFLLFVCTCTFELLQSTLFLQQMSSLLLCMLEWCLRVPTHILLESFETPKSLLFSVFRTLHLVLQGSRPPSKAVESLLSPEAEIFPYTNSSSVATSLSQEEDNSRLFAYPSSRMPLFDPTPTIARFL